MSDVSGEEQIGTNAYVMQLLRKDVCRLSERLSQGKSRVTRRHTKGKVKLCFLQFARFYDGRNIWTMDSKQSQGPSQIIQRSVSANAVGISYLTQRELNQETVYVFSCRKTQIQLKNGCQNLHVLELRIDVLVLICYKPWKSLFLKAGS